jgi:DNA polymerase I-like protein with 3'-5' exonuclease and polymerase domains
LLKIWTSADTPTVTKTIGKSLKAMKPNIPDHQFLKWGEHQEPPVPGEGEVVMVCGTKALDKLQKAGLAPKNRTVNSMRETPIKRGLGHYLVTFDPNVVNSEPEQGQVIDWDVRLATRLMRTGGMAPTVGKYQWVNDFAPVINYIEQQFTETGRAVPVTMDLETHGLYPYYPDKDIVSISFTAEPGTAHVLYVGPQTHPIELDADVCLFDQIQWLLTSPLVKLRLANGKFDMIWVAEKWGIECTNFTLDTLLVGSLLDENRSNSLNLHAKIFTDMGGYDDAFNAKVDKSRFDLIVPDEQFLTYAGGDTDACLRSSDVLIDQLACEPQLMQFYVTILHPAARAFEKIERRGVLVDPQKMAVLADDLKKEIAENQKLALDLLPYRLKAKHRDKIDEQLYNGKNPLTAAILKDYFFSPAGLNLKPILTTPKSGEPSTAKSHLKMFGDNPQAAQMVSILSAKDSAEKTLSTFVEGFLKHLRPDMRLHPSFMLFHGAMYNDDDEGSGSTTGRLSAKDPAFQTIPKKTKWAKRLRECYPAPEGKVILQIDYSQGELKIVACLAPEPTMLASYEQGLDLHAVTGAKLAQVDLATFLTWKDNDDDALAALFEKHRGNAKPANFGLLYGQMAEGFRQYAWSNYGIKLTIKEAEQMRDAFFELYPGLLNYHQNMRTFMHANECVVSPLGRIRHLPTIKSWDMKVRSAAERQGINAPVQADMMIWAIALIEDAGIDVEIVGTIHDAFMAYVDEDKVQQVAAQISEIMSSLPFDVFGWKPQLKFTADAEAGPNLASLKKLKIAA